MWLVALVDHERTRLKRMGCEKGRKEGEKDQELYIVSL